MWRRGPEATWSRSVISTIDVPSDSPIPGVLSCARVGFGYRANR
jgi:hypothetical protein